MSDQSECPEEPKTEVAIPSPIVRVFPPTLLEGENAAAYHELLAQISATVRPADILEQMWVRDVADHTWDILRLRCLKANLVRVNAHKGLKAILETQLDWQEAKALARNWGTRNAEAISKVDEILASIGLTLDAVNAQTVALHMDAIECFNRMIIDAESQRNMVLREIERHRAALAQALRRAAQQVEEGQFTEVSAPQIEDRSAA